jgi:hypothetical protein
MVDSYRFEGKPTATRSYEGENVGLAAVNSTICVPLRVDFIRNEDGTTKEEIALIPHTFINRITVETFFEK